VIEDPNRKTYEKYGWRLIATGTWFYDRIVPRPVSIYAKPASLAWARYDDDGHLEDASPIPETQDGFFYFCVPGGKQEHLTLDLAKAEADTMPWGPIRWD
jgi:hypothetical protein